MTRIKVTPENIDEVRELVLACDMADEIKIGQEIETWAITYCNGQRGQMTVYHPIERGAIFTGGESVWGDWEDEKRILHTDDGVDYDENGEEVEDEEDDEGEASL